MRRIPGSHVDDCADERLEVVSLRHLFDLAGQTQQLSDQRHEPLLTEVDDVTNLVEFEPDVANLR